jgi:ribokinase
VSRLDARVAVLGHVEWIEFAPVDHVPAPGEIVHATDPFAAPAGGGAVAARQQALLAREAVFLTAVGDDPLGDRTAAALAELGPAVHVARRAGQGQRHGWTHLDAHGERAITILGPRLAPVAADPLPWDLLATCDGCFVTAGDAGAIRRAREARVLTATPRALPALAEADVALDVLIGSRNDPHERLDPDALPQAPGVLVRTDGGRGGTWERADGTSGGWAAAPLPGPVVDSYGCGDSFAAALTVGLGAGLPLDDALALAARAGAACLTGRGPYGAQLAL